MFARRSRARGIRPGRLTGLLLAPVLAGALLGLMATPASATTKHYVALGDSYASGVGTRDYRDDGTSCYRSPKTYAALVAARRHLRLRLVACAGATTADVRRHQLSPLHRSTRYVSLTVGGNDLGFEPVLRTCALPASGSSCATALRAAERTLRTRLPGRLRRLLTAVRVAAPRARVVVVGYPHLFNGTDCNAGTFFSAREEARINRAADALDRLLRRRAAKAKVTFVDPRKSFRGHAVCDRHAWVNGLSNPLVNSFHPNRAGYRAYARLVTHALLRR